MLRDPLLAAEALVLRRPGAVIVSAVALTLVATWLGAGIELRTARHELAPPGDPEQARWDALREEFNGPTPLIITVEAVAATVTTAQLESAVRAAAEQLRADPLVSRVFYRVDSAWLADHLLWLVAPGELERATTAIAELLDRASGRLLLEGFAALDTTLAARVRSSIRAGTAVPGDAAELDATALVDLLRFQRRFLLAPEDAVEELAGDPLALVNAVERGALTANGFLATDDERTLFLLVNPATVQDTLEGQRELVALARSVLARQTGPGERMRFGLTGTPAMDVEEMAAIGRDGRATSLIASSGVFVLALLAFRRRRHAVLGLLTLTLGVGWSIGAVWIELGYLNLITTALIPILVGMGIDYAVHPISLFETDTHAASREAAVRAMMRRTGPAVLISALTTAAAFFCFLFMQFRGFAELGLVTGVGVLLCLLAALLVLPALLMLFGRHDSGGRRAPVDLVWTAALARSLCAAPRASIAAASVLTLAAAWAATETRVDADLLELLPASAESLRYLDVVNERSPLSSEFNLVVSDGEQALAAMAARARSEATIGRFESVLRFVPADAEGSARAIERTRGVLESVDVADAPFSAPELAAAARRLEEALADAADDAFGTGLGAVAGALERARGEAEAVARLAADATDDDARSWARGEERLRHRVRELLARLRRASGAERPTVATLPAALRERFVTATGRHVAYLYPAGDIYERAFLERFNAASRRVSPTAIGFPVLFADHSRLITAGFGVAFAFGAALVFVLLAADLRSAAHTMLALVPVVVGAIWMLGLMRLTGLAFNFANLIAVPIVLGVGIDAGVHLVHRLRQREPGVGMIVALRQTGRAVLIAALTTMIGFGSLGLATHRGMASLGILLLLGVGACTLAALWVLPNLAIAARITER